MRFAGKTIVEAAATLPPLGTVPWSGVIGGGWSSSTFHEREARAVAACKARRTTNGRYIVTNGVVSAEALMVLAKDIVNPWKWLEVGRV